MQIVDGLIPALAVRNQFQLWRAGGIEAFGFRCENRDLHIDWVERQSPVAFRFAGLRDGGGTFPPPVISEQWNRSRLTTFVQSLHWLGEFETMGRQLLGRQACPLPWLAQPERPVAVT